MKALPPNSDPVIAWIKIFKFEPLRPVLARYVKYAKEFESLCQEGWYEVQNFGQKGGGFCLQKFSSDVVVCWQKLELENETTT